MSPGRDGPVDPHHLGFPRAPAGNRMALPGLLGRIKITMSVKAPRMLPGLLLNMSLETEVSIRLHLKHAGVSYVCYYACRPPTFPTMLSHTRVYLIHSLHLPPSSFLPSSSPNKSRLMNSGQEQWLSTEILFPLLDCVCQSRWPTQVVPAKPAS